MSTTLAEIEGLESGPLYLTAKAGPAYLDDRLVVEVHVPDSTWIGSGHTVKRLRDELTAWLGDAPDRPSAASRLVELPWGSWVPRHAWVRVGTEAFGGAWHVWVRFSDGIERSPGYATESVARDYARRCAEILEPPQG